MILTSVALLLIIFIFIGTFRHRKGMSTAEFFQMSKEGEISDYTNTTVAYSLQVAVTIYFIYWGFEYGLANIWFVLTWGIGLLVFSLAAPKLADFLARYDTYFEFIGGDSRTLKIVGAFMFLASLLGLVFTEFYFAADFLKSVARVELGYEDGLGQPAAILIFGVLVVTVLFYSSLGGMRKVVLTDKWQLAISYVASAVFFLSLAPAISHRGSTEVFLWVFGPACALYVILAILALSDYAAQLKAGQTISDTPASVFVMIMAPIASAVLILITIFFFYPGVSSLPPAEAIAFPKPVDAMVSVEHGIWPLLGFGIANVVWQFGDYTAYHRLSLLKLGEDRVRRIRVIRRSVLGTIISSPLTWSLGILMGMAIDAANLVPEAGQAVFGEFTALAISTEAQTNGMLYLAAWALAVFLTSVLMSTVDSGFISIGQMIIRDISGQAGHGPLRFIVLVSITMAIICLAWLQDAFSLNIFVLLNSVYSWGLIFAPIAVYRLGSGSRFNSMLALFAALAGAIVGFMGAFDPLKLPPLVALVFPTLSALTTTTAILLIGTAVLGRR